jgi:hypothetical protein
MSTTATANVRVPSDDEVAAIDEHLAGLVVDYVGIFKNDADRQRYAEAAKNTDNPLTKNRLLREFGQPVYGAEELAKALRRIARLAPLPVPHLPGRPVSRAEAIGIFTAITGATAPAGPLRRTWEAVMYAVRKFTEAQVAPRVEPMADARQMRLPPEPTERPAPVSATPEPAPPKTTRGFDDETDELVRKWLRDKGWGTEPTKPGKLWILSPPEAKQLWRVSGNRELLDACAVQDSHTSDSTRQKKIRAAFRRVTGS